MDATTRQFVSRIRNLLVAGALCAAPVSAFGAAPVVVNPSGGSIVIPNPVPGGITLVPGTVVIPAVGGTTVTGSVPLAGTVGSAGVRDFNPGLSAAPNPMPGSAGALYPPAANPQIAVPLANQSSLPQSAPANEPLNVIQNSLPVAGPSCIGGVAPDPSIADCR
jgi:hypothetical protein